MDDSEREQLRRERERAGRRKRALAMEALPPSKKQLLADERELKRAQQVAAALAQSVARQARVDKARAVLDALAKSASGGRR